MEQKELIDHYLRILNYYDKLIQPECVEFVKDDNLIEEKQNVTTDV